MTLFLTLAAISFPGRPKRARFRMGQFLSVVRKVSLTRFLTRRPITTVLFHCVDDDDDDDHDDDVFT